MSGSPATAMMLDRRAVLMSSTTSRGRPSTSSVQTASSPDAATYDATWTTGASARRLRDARS